jgi:SAM-dependent methyltransferase
MAHIEQGIFFRKCFSAFPQTFSNPKSRVIDFGSLDINGGPHLDIQADYLGVDIGPGPNVDLVCPAQEVGFPSSSFDATISSECLEHNPFWRETLFQMARLTKSGGLVVWSCAGIGRAVHGVSYSPDNGISAPYIAKSSNYYCNVDARSAKMVLNHEGWYDDYVFIENFKSHDTYFVGIRSNASSKSLETFRSLKVELISVYGEVDAWRLRRLLYQFKLRVFVEKYYDLLRFIKVAFTADQKTWRIKRKIKKWFKVASK